MLGFYWDILGYYMINYQLYIPHGLAEAGTCARAAVATTPMASLVLGSQMWTTADGTGIVLSVMIPSSIV